MNDSELFELCKDVYERTGWDDLDAYQLAHTSIPVPPLDLPAYEIREGKEFRSEHWTHKRFPLYTSDYLLENLPSGARIEKDSAMMGEKQFYAAQMVYFKGTPKEHMLNCGDKASPLKALLKLTLALHEAGELPINNKTEKETSDVL